MTRTFPKRELFIILLVAFAGLVVLPCLNAFAPEGSSLHVSSFTLSIYGKYLTYAVLAVLRVPFAGLIALFVAIECESPALAGMPSALKGAAVAE